MLRILSIFFLAVLIGCTGGGSSTAARPEPAEQTGRPDWIEKGETRTQKKSMFWMAVGSGDTPEEASLSARQEVAAQIKTHIRCKSGEIFSAVVQSIESGYCRYPMHSTLWKHRAVSCINFNCSV